MSTYYQDYTCQGCKLIYRNWAPTKKSLEAMKNPFTAKTCGCGSWKTANKGEIKESNPKRFPGIASKVVYESGMIPIHE